MERAGMRKRAMRGLVVGAVMWAASSTWAAPVAVKRPSAKLEGEGAVGGGGGVKGPGAKRGGEGGGEGGGKVTWRGGREGKGVLGRGALGLTVDGEELGTGASLGEVRRQTIEERYPTWGNHAVALNHCNEAVVEATSAGGKKFEVAVRAFDDGGAGRATVPMEGTHAIAGEGTTCVLPAALMAWWAKYGYEEPFASGELEQMPEKVALAPPVTFKTPQGLYVAVTEADNDDFPDMGVERE